MLIDGRTLCLPRESTPERVGIKSLQLKLSLLVPGKRSAALAHEFFLFEHT